MNLNEKINYYKMFPEHKFAFVELQSEFLYLDELEKLNNEYKSDINYPNIHSLLVIIDKRSRLGFPVKKLSKLSASYNTEPQKNNHKIIVWLVSQPLITALTHLFLLKINDNSMYCSTLQKAYKLLNLSIDYNSFLKLLNC